MIKSFCPGFLVLLALSTTAFAQTSSTEPPATRSRVVVTNTLPPPTKIVQPTPKPTPIIVGTTDEVSGPSDDNDSNERPRIVSTSVGASAIDGSRSSTGF